MALTLTVRSGDVRVPSITLDSPRVVIGRSSSCELCLPDPSVSHRHASIRQRGSDYIVLDEGSTNGTFVGSVKLSPGAPRLLRHGEMLRVGRIWLSVQLEQVPVSPQSVDLTKQIALGLVAGALKADGQPCAPAAKVVSGPDVGQELTLAAFNTPYVIGRQKNAALRLQDDDISRRHLQLERRGGRVWVRDLGSKNGAVLAENHLAPKAEAPWLPGQQLQVGNCCLELTDPLIETLFEIDRAPDERIEESVEPPEVNASGDNSGSGTASQSKRSSRAAESSERAHAEIAQPPKARPRALPRNRRWGSADVLVALLALVVLALSISGIVWLMGQ